MRPRWSVLLAIAVLPLIAACDSTAPNGCVNVEGRFDSTIPEFVVSYHTGVDAAATTDTLAARYGFSPIQVYPESRLFTMPAPQPKSVMDGLRCEPSIEFIEYNAHTYPT